MPFIVVFAQRKMLLSVRGGGILAGLKFQVSTESELGAK